MKRLALMLVVPVTLVALVPTYRGDHRSGGEVAPRVTVRTATCAGWNTAGAADRRRLVEAMRVFFGGPVDAAGQRGQVVADDRADALFDGVCRRPFAVHFQLWRLYAGAAGFTAGRQPGQTGSGAGSGAWVTGTAAPGPSRAP